MKKLFVPIALVGLMFASVAFAQGWLTAEPLYGTYTLNTGFTPDPQSVDVVAGGAEPASNIGAPAHCVGSIVSAQPDVRLHYTAGTTFPLRFYAVSTVDTTLVVNAADGNWYCNDDGATATAGLNPVVDIPNPPSGQYDIWVGTWAGGTGNATVFVTELLSNGP